MMRNAVAIAALVTTTLLAGPTTISASSEGCDIDYVDYQKPFKIRTTCYTWTGDQCANGSYPVEGLSVAGREEWMGKTIVMYECNKDGSMGDFIGYYQFTDTGYGIERMDDDGVLYGTITRGESIDMYRDDIDGVVQWIKRYGDYTYIQIIDAKG